jgi:hypothetical protein
MQASSFPGKNLRKEKRRHEAALGFFEELRISVDFVWNQRKGRRWIRCFRLP